MSTVVELAELEAAIAEAELTEDEAERVKAAVTDGIELAGAVAAVLEDRQADERPPAPPAAEPTEPTEKQLRELDRAQSTWHERARRIMGGFMDGFEPCEACDGLGLAPPGEPPPAVVQPDTFRECEACHGYGKVRTGSRDPQWALVDCAGCAGRGYQRRTDAAPVAPPSPVPVFAPPEENGSALNVPPPPGADSNVIVQPQWGHDSWMGDPNIGQ